MQTPHPPQDFCKFLKDVSSLGHPCLQVPDSTCVISVSHHRRQNVKLSLATVSKQKAKFTYTKLLTDIVDFSKKVGRDGREVLNNAQQASPMLTSFGYFTQGLSMDPSPLTSPMSHCLTVFSPSSPTVLFFMLPSKSKTKSFKQSISSLFSDILALALKGSSTLSSFAGYFYKQRQPPS